MNNNDILIRIRYALDLKETELVDIFKTGGVELTRHDVQERLVKSQDYSADRDTSVDETASTAENIECSNSELVCFLNGLIIFKRGAQEPKADQPAKDDFAIANNINNILLKKMKIALSLSSEDMLNIFESAEVIVTKGELGALFRAQGHRNYKPCGDKFARKFLKGLAVRYRT